jgi:hypothetical protein
MRSFRLLLIGCFSLLIALPGLQMRFRFVPEESLSGVKARARAPSLTLPAWWKGELQSQAEAWFDEHIGFRGHAVRTDNQIGLSLFREVSSRAVDPPVLGRRMMVYEEHYVTAYDGDVPYSDRGLRRLSRDLHWLQESLAERGIAFVLVIAPSKVAIYPEYLPTGFVRPDGLRPPTAYERMLPMLKTEGVHLVDGHAIFEEDKGRSGHALFPPGGIHWNRYGVFLVMRRLWAALEQQLGRPLVDLRCRAVLEDDEPSRADEETDVADLVNAWHVGHADWKFPRPDLVADEGGERLRPKVVVIGDSFWNLPEAMIVTHRLAARSDFFYYFKDLRPDGAGAIRENAARPAYLESGKYWDYVFSADAIVIEVSEAVLGDAGYGFVQQARQNLRAAPSPRPPAP